MKKESFEQALEIQNEIEKLDKKIAVLKHVREMSILSEDYGFFFGTEGNGSRCTFCLDEETLIEIKDIVVKKIKTYGIKKKNLEEQFKNL